MAYATPKKMAAKKAAFKAQNVGAPPMKGGTMPPKVMKAMVPTAPKGRMASGRGTTRGK